MIDISIYQQRLQALDLYMSFWINEQDCIDRWLHLFNETGVIIDRCEWLPSFDDWYYEYFLTMYKPI